MSTSQVRKRIVLFHTSGPYKGLARISGYLEGTAKQVADAMLPSLHYKEGGVQKEVQHWKTLPRAVWYREFTLAAKGRLNDFNPVQI